MNTQKETIVSSDLSLGTTTSDLGCSVSTCPLSEKRSQRRPDIVLEESTRRQNLAMLPVSSELSSKMANMAFCCVVLVVFIHVGTPVPLGSGAWFFIEFFRNTMGAMAVPYFFLASGFFLTGHMTEADWYPRELKKRFWTLLLPYVLWSLLYAVYLLPVKTLANLHAHRSWSWHLSSPEWLDTFGLNSFCSHFPLLGPFWFLRWLMCLCLVSPFLFWFVRKTRIVGLLTFYPFIVLMRFVAMHSPAWSWVGMRMWLAHLSGLFYFLLGVWWRMGELRTVPAWAKRLSVLLGLAFWIIQLASLVAAGFGIALSDVGIGMYFIQHIHFLIPCLLTFVWKCMPSGKWPTWLVGSSFGIFAVHPFFINLLNNVLWFERLGLGEGGMCMLRLVCGLGGGLVTVIVLKKVFPRLANVLLGGR